jgi:hypothetical protein
MIETLKRIPAAKVAGWVALGSTFLIIYLHAVFGTHAGALWRDEVNSLEIATMHGLSEMWSNLCFGSFPALFFVILRVVAGVPATVSDATLRVFGISVGLLILGMIWLNARWLRLGFPLLSLALIGLNPMVIRYGDSIRAYGLGIALMLLVLGAMWRLLDETTAWTQSRVQGGQRILDYQGISFPLADSATDATVGRLLAIHVARMVDADADVKLIHAKASMAKLFVSEAAGRCADRSVQAFGGRGYLRSNVAERFNRELRVDRIWEGTSEVQRLIIARALERRGVEATIH